MHVDFSEFTKLTPERRVKELQELIEDLKKQITQSQEDIKTAEELLLRADEEARVLENITIPERDKKAKTVEELTTPETLKPTRELEDLLATAPRKEETIHQLAHTPVSELYAEIKNIYQRERETGLETQQDRDKIYAIRKGLEIKKEEGYKPSTKDQHLMTAAEQMADAMYQKADNMYKR